MEVDQIHTDLLSIKDWAQAHEMRDTAQFEKISSQLSVITHNHLKHIQDATQKTDEKVDELLIQLENWWLKKILFSVFWMMGLVVVGVLIAWLTKMV